MAMPLGRVPVLDHHGLLVPQSNTIVRYLAGVLALAGGHEHERVLTDAM